ncbi:MAG TPA: DUF4149 domain-containing protein [Polyangiaceae bacterium]|nr:DUF4149 domain-containing protein [Polyangiaceae bacterium]
MTRPLRRVFTAVGSLAVALWLGGLVALGALAAPVVFSVVPLPTSADAMTVVFRRFDLLAMTCAAVALGCEAGAGFARALGQSQAGGSDPARLVDHARVAATALAAAAAAFEGASISPRIAELHAGGAIRGVADAGRELARLHDLAESLGKSEVLLLGAVVVLRAFSGAFSDGGARQAAPRPPG